MPLDYDYLFSTDGDLTVTLDGQEANLARMMALHAGERRDGFRHDDNSRLSTAEFDALDTIIDGLLLALTTGEVSTETMEYHGHTRVVNVATSSQSLVNVPGLYLTITANGGIVVVIAAMNLYYSGSQYAMMQLAVDGSLISNSEVVNNHSNHNLFTMHAYQSIAEQQYSHNVRWRAYGGLTLNAYRGHIWIIEL